MTTLMDHGYKIEIETGEGHKHDDDIDDDGYDGDLATRLILFDKKEKVI